MPYRPVEFLSDEELAAIHDASLQLLATVGVQFHDPAAVDIFKQHGFKTDGSVVTFTRAAIAAAVQSVPASFTVRARNPEKSVTVGAGSPVLAPGYGAPFIIDADGNHRKGTLEDYHNLVRLVDASTNLDVSGHLLVEPDDVPADVSHIHMLRASMHYSDKPFIGSGSLGQVAVEDTMAMASILFGGEDAVRGAPVTFGLINSLSPLAYGPEMCQAMIGYAQWGQPLIVAPAIMAGTTGPVTLAGTIAQQNAEILAGIALVQLVNPGNPVLYGCVSAPTDMKTGAMAIGSPEMAQILVCAAQLARHYGLPTRGGGALTDSNTLDAQSGYESLHLLSASYAAGLDFILHAAGIMSSFLAVSYEKFVLDDELCSMVRRMWQRVDVNAKTLALDAIREVGHGGNHLVTDHTMAHFRSALWQPDLAYRKGLHAWDEDDRPTFIQRARAHWQHLLETHEPPPLDATTARQLQAYVDERTA